VLILSVSLTSESYILKHGYRLLPREASTLAYEFIFKDSRVLFNAYFMTIASTVIGTLINVYTTALYAYPLSRSDFPYKKALSIFILITMLFGGGLAPAYIMNVNVLHLKNTFWALVLPSLGGGFNIFIMCTYFRLSSSQEIIDSAQIDGAGEFRIFFQLILPISKPVIATIALFNVFGFWNNWANCMYYIDKPEFYTVQYVMQSAIMNLQYIRDAFTNNQELANEAMKNMPTEGVRMAMVLIGIGPIIVAYPFFQKYFVKGLTIGSIKG